MPIHAQLLKQDPMLFGCLMSHLQWITQVKPNSKAGRNHFQIWLNYTMQAHLPIVSSPLSHYPNFPKRSRAWMVITLTVKVPGCQDQMSQIKVLLVELFRSLSETNLCRWCTRTLPRQSTHTITLKTLQTMFFLQTQTNHSAWKLHANVMEVSLRRNSWILFGPMKQSWWKERGTRTWPGHLKQLSRLLLLHWQHLLLIMWSLQNWQWRNLSSS